MRLAVAVLVILGVIGCGQPERGNVNGILLPQATGVIEVPEGPTIELAKPGAAAKLGALPVGDTIKIAAHIDVPWTEVRDVIKAIHAAGKRAVPLVGVRNRVRAFVISDELLGESIALTAQPNGKACVSPPGVPEAKCVQTMSKKNIDRGFVRGLMSEAVNRYRIYDVDVEAQGAIRWIDVVRAVDGARTCCRTTIRVKLNDL
jgi:hypothetical protein